MSLVSDAPPILTPRTVDLLRSKIPEEAFADLKARVESVVRNHYAPFLQKSGEAPAWELELAVGRYHVPRIELLTLLLNMIPNLPPGTLLRDALAFYIQTLAENGWKLGAGSSALREAVEEYGEIVKSVRALSPSDDLATPPYDLMRDADRMDFCLTSLMVYLEGDIADADPDRTEQLCAEARSSTKRVKEVFAEIRRGSLSQGDRRATLLGLFGAWPDSEEAERDLDSLYRSRLDIGREAR